MEGKGKADNSWQQIRGRINETDELESKWFRVNGPAEARIHWDSEIYNELNSTELRACHVCPQVKLIHSLPDLFAAVL